MTVATSHLELVCRAALTGLVYYTISLFAMHISYSVIYLFSRHMSVIYNLLIFYTMHVLYDFLISYAYVCTVRFPYY